MNRIYSILSFINDSDIVADIGCDQAKLGILLAKKGIKSYAFDISDKVIKSAKDKIYKLGLSEYITLEVSDGLALVPKCVNTLVLSGMGAYTIIDILSKRKKEYNKIITISNNNNDMLREYMSKYYNIICEKIILDNGIFYELIVFSLGKCDYSDKEILIGTNFIIDEEYNLWKKYFINKNCKILVSSNNRNIRAKKIVDYLK